MLDDFLGILGQTGFYGGDRSQTPAPPTAQPPAVAPLDLSIPDAQMGEWEKLIRNFSSMVADTEKEPKRDIMSEIDALKKQIAGATFQMPADVQANTRYPNGVRPRVHNPLEAPDTGEVDTTGVPVGYFSKNRRFESGDNSRATNPITGAGGDYQFLPSTWKGLMKEAPHLGLTEDGLYDSKQQDAAMRYYTAKSVQTLKPLLGRAPTGGELYVAHLLGHSGGPRVIMNQDAPIEKIIDAASIRANPWLRNYATGRDLVTDLNRRFG